MVRYFYKFDYNEEGNTDDQGTIPPIVFNVHVHTIADKYDIPNLLKLAALRFKERAQLEWNSAEFADAVELVYENCTTVNKELRDTIVSVATEHAKALSGRDSGARFREVAGSVPALGLALWSKQAADAERASVKLRVTGYACPNVNCHWVAHARYIIGWSTPTCLSCSYVYPTPEWQQYPIRT